MMEKALLQVIKEEKKLQEEDLEAKLRQKEEMKEMEDKLESEEQ